MANENGFLVVGGDSLVGGGLYRALEKRGHQVFATTRKTEKLDSKHVYLDFESEEPFVPPVSVDYVYVVAAATNYDRCEKDPLAKLINEELIPRFVKAMLERGLFVTFISTNSVFGGDRPWPHEDDQHEPGIPYAKQKDEAEKTIRVAASELGAEDRLNIVRLTKILDKDTSPLPNWFSAWKQGETVNPFSDLIFAPMSVQFVGEALAILGEKRVSGNLHLSGADNVSYVDFAYALAERMGVEKNLIAPTTATEKGIHIAFKPRFSGLGMQRTSSLTGVLPQNLADVVEDLLLKNSINN